MRLAASGFAVLAVCSAVAFTVVASTAAAVADAPGVPVGASGIDLPARSVVTPTAVPSAAADQSPAPVVEEAVTPEVELGTEVFSEREERTGAQTVPPPAPFDLASGEEAVPQPAAPPQPPASAPNSPEPTATEQALPSEVDEWIVRDAFGSGSWDDVYAWAAERGLPRDVVDRWVESLAERYQNDDGQSWGHREPPASTGSPSDTTLPQRGDGSKRYQSHGSPDHRD